MNKKILLVLPVVVFGLHEPVVVDAQDTCQVVEIPSSCSSTGQVTINTQSETITVAPANFCASRGQEITFNVVPEGSARIAPKNGGSWPSGGPASSFTVTAPQTPGEYDYEIFLGDGRCVDPRISVD